MDRMQLLQETEVFVLDMDGTFYLGGRILPGALSFLAQTVRLGKRFLFFTNNSSASPAYYMDKLAGMGCRIDRRQLMTSGDVMIRYLQRQHPGKRVYLLGTRELAESFAAAGIALVDGILLSAAAPDLVVAGFDKSLTFGRLAAACTAIRNGAGFLATHPDINCPVENGFLPDCGAICAAISLSTGIEPKYVGKPCPETAEMLLEATGVRRERLTFVGDRLYTDIAAGVRNGARGALVLTGETREADLASAEVPPDAVFASLAEMSALMERL